MSKSKTVCYAALAEAVYDVQLWLCYDAFDHIPDFLRNRGQRLEPEVYIAPMVFEPDLTRADVAALLRRCMP